MGQATSEIEAHIAETRTDLGSNLQELEQKVKSVTDWKQHFQKNPMPLLGVAFGGGALVGTMLGGGKSRRRERRFSNPTNSEPRRVTDRQKHEALETWDNIKGALIGVAAMCFKDFIGEVVPGFHEQFQRMEEKTKAIRPTEM
jgi:hypothetical protein